MVVQYSGAEVDGDTLGVEVPADWSAPNGGNGALDCSKYPLSPPAGPSLGRRLAAQGAGWGLGYSSLLL